MFLVKLLTSKTANDQRNRNANAGLEPFLFLLKTVKKGNKKQCRDTVDATSPSFGEQSSQNMTHVDNGEHDPPPEEWRCWHPPPLQETIQHTYAGLPATGGVAQPGNQVPCSDGKSWLSPETALFPVDCVCFCAISRVIMAYEFSFRRVQNARHIINLKDSGLVLLAHLT